MSATFFISAAIAIAATFLAITRKNVVHALLYFITSLLATGVIFFIFGAQFAAALVVIINAGAIMVLFVFVIMMLNLGPQTVEQEHFWLKPKMWVGPSILSIILIIDLIYTLTNGKNVFSGPNITSPKEVGVVLFGPYVLGVELASMLLLAGLLGAYHLGRGAMEPKAGDKK